MVRVQKTERLIVHCHCYSYCAIYEHHNGMSNNSTFLSNLKRIQEYNSSYIAL